MLKPRLMPPRLLFNARLLVPLLATFAVNALSAEPDPVPLDETAISLAEVSDRSPLSFEESVPYYAVLDHVRHVPAPDLRQRAAEFLRQRRQASPQYQAGDSGFPVFVDMIEHPEAYRGQPVTLQGHLIRFVSYEAGPNEFGIEQLFEGWLVTEDSQTHPVIVVTTANVDGLPIGEELIDGVTVSGYFLKLHNYSSRDRKVRFAPMILAETMHWSPPPAQGPAVFPRLMRYGGLALLMLVILRLIWRLRRPPGSRAQRRLADELPAEAPGFLEDLATLTVASPCTNRPGPVTPSRGPEGFMPPDDRHLRLAVLISGGGTTLLNFLRKIERGELAARVALVIASRADCAGVERSRAAGLSCEVVSPRDFADVRAFSDDLFSRCRQAEVDLVTLAGFLSRIEIPDDFHGRVMNIHPALIPAFCGQGMYGHHVHEAVLARGAKVSGCTVHFADNEYDHGPIILQQCVPVLDDDTPDTLAARVFDVECELYPEAIRLYAAGRLATTGRAVRIDRMA